MKEIALKPDIKNLIYEIRGKYVMLGSDLAKLYQCKNGTKSINLAVARNKEKFPDDFCFRLSDKERESFWFQIETKIENIEKRGGKYKNPYVFTEEGVAMLATVLHTEVATEVSVNIMRTFAVMRKYISTNLIEQKYINNMVIRHDERINLLETTFNEFKTKEVVNEIYFNGQIYDAYSKIVDIMKEANKELIVIDSYADKSVLDMISNVDVKVTLITSAKCRLKEIDIDKYNKQYNNLNIMYNDTFHDRYIIVDKEKVYHLGTSLNNAGSKTFSINILDDDAVKRALIDTIYLLSS